MLSAASPSTLVSSSSKLKPLFALCVVFTFWVNASYRWISSAVTDFRACAMDSSKCAFVMCGTGSGISSSSPGASISPLSMAACRACSAAIASLIAYFVARWQISVMSAPEKPSVALASLSRSTSGARGDLRRFAPKMDRRESRSGSGMYTSWSSRPGRVTAASMMSGRLVAPMTKTFFRLPTPSISVRIWLRTRSPASELPAPPEPRAFAIESISSKNRMHGAAERALSKRSRTFASDSPNHMVSSSGPLMLMKFAPHSLAMALARRVLPQPGGP
mmetsp:Transcript_4150/g.16097  ORF Transcript_4150/g.16097 Transcript_4150/m.16097 type:complete len:276 (+) Transcript_4150:859-1686(+)